MIYRNQITDPSQFSLNPILNKQRKQKYKLHLNKIFQIQNRQFKSKSKKQAKQIENKILQLTKLKQFSRNFKQKQENFQRTKNDIIMLGHINQRLKTNPQQDFLRKTRSTLKFNSRVISTERNLKSGQITDQIRHQNKRLMKSITQNSFDQNKFRQTLKDTTKKYLKVRDHMRRLKTNQQSLKRLTSSSINNRSSMSRSSTNKNLQSTHLNQEHRTDKIIKMKTQLTQRYDQIDLNKQKLNLNQKIKETMHSSTTSIFKIKQSKNKLKIKQSLTSQIMSKKLKNVHIQ